MILIGDGDVRVKQIFDGGEIDIERGLVEMSGGLETAAYLSLFGGNEDDSGRDGDPKTWWGNLDEVNAVGRYVSETQHLVQSLPLITSNLRRVEDAAMRDLQWFLDEKVASLVEVTARISALNTLELNVRIEALGEESNFQFVENWKALQARQIEPLPGVISAPQEFLLLESGDLFLLEDGVGLIELEN